MATARVALGSVLGTVSSLANAIGTTANTLTTGVDMVNDWATNARLNQRKRTALNEVHADKRMLTELTTEMTNLDIEIEEFCSKSVAHKELFNSNYAQLEAALAKFNGEAQASN
jgi:phage terminase large subunit-like protein